MAIDRYLPLRGSPGRVPSACQPPQSSQTLTASANNTMVIQSEVHGFVTSPSRGPASGRQTQQSRLRVLGMTVLHHVNMPCKLKQPRRRVRLVRTPPRAGLETCPDKQLDPQNGAIFGGPPTCSGHRKQHLQPLKGTALIGGDGAAPQACGIHIPLQPWHRRRAAMVITIVSVQPTKLLCARYAATDASHVLTQAKRLPTKQR